MKITIHVDPRYGEWNAESIGTIPMEQSKD
jgi:hypothetical protein